jgi:hypothetical protein
LTATTVGMATPTFGYQADVKLRLRDAGAGWHIAGFTGAAAGS